jgi:hypothetical protein
MSKMRRQQKKYGYSKQIVWYLSGKIIQNVNADWMYPWKECVMLPLKENPERDFGDNLT